MKGKKRIVALLLCVLTLICLMPTAAFAAEQSVTIESQSNSAFDYLEYYSSGGWHDLNTPKHTIEQTGEVAYCVEHSLGNPHGDDYTATSPSKVFSATTLKGLYTKALGNLSNYFDYEGFGRDIALEENGQFVEGGYVYANGDSMNVVYDPVNGYEEAFDVVTEKMLEEER